MVFGQDEVGFPDSAFEIDTDANTKVDNWPDGESSNQRIDWNTVSEDDQVDPSIGANDDSFGQGSKEDTPVPTPVTGSIPPNKSDLVRFGMYRENVGLTSRFLHLYWTRVQDPSGTTNMDFEFNQDDEIPTGAATPARTYLDLLIQYDLENGGTVPQLFLVILVSGAVTWRLDRSRLRGVKQAALLE